MQVLKKSENRKLPDKAVERRQAVKRNIILSVIIGTLITYLPFWQLERGKQLLGAVAFSFLVWIFVQSSEPGGGSRERW